MGNSRIVIALVMVVAGCRPMYGDKAQKLGDPKPIRHQETPEPPPKPVYVETCDSVDFRRPAKGLVRNSKDAARFVGEGDTKVATANTASEIDKRVELLLQGIDRYSRALQRDPYDPAATLKLALAYHEVHRKGCALALLRRLETLSTHPDFHDEADRQKSLVRDNGEWFKDYRAEALNQIP
ncbi:MAG TPA: hypothetical protein VFQ53_11255 [Kofleriaceae bacterium]|nr:hypothetical protein [Kofleriaceae bacterium]